MVELAPEPIAEEPEQVVEPAEEPKPLDEVTPPVEEKVEPVKEPEPELPPVEPVEKAEPLPEPEPVEPPAAEEPVVEQAEIEPVEPEEPDPVVEEVTRVLDDVAIPLPVIRPVPEKIEKKVVEKKKPTRKKIVAAERKTREKPQDTAEVTRKTASSTPRAASVSPERWRSRVMSHLRGYKSYPVAARRARQEGVVRIRFRIDDRGNVLSASVVGSSGFADLDQAALSMVRKASPVPTPPSDINKTITAPVQFYMN